MFHGHRIALSDLSTVLDIPERTLRMYRTMGLLDPPTMRGRTGYYTIDHLAQLRLVKGLTERGFPLAAVATLMGTTLSRMTMSVLLEQLSHAPGEEDEDFSVITPDFVALVNAADATIIDDLVDLGVLRVDDDGNIGADNVGLALTGDLVAQGTDLLQLCYFGREIGRLAAAATDVINAQRHPSVRDPRFGRSLLDASSTIFRETIRVRLRR